MQSTPHQQWVFKQIFPQVPIHEVKVLRSLPVLVLRGFNFEWFCAIQLVTVIETLEGQRKNSPLLMGITINVQKG